MSGHVDRWCLATIRLKFSFFLGYSSCDHPCLPKQVQYIIQSCLALRQPCNIFPCWAQVEDDEGNDDDSDAGGQVGQISKPASKPRASMDKPRASIDSRPRFSVDKPRASIGSRPRASIDSRPRFSIDTPGVDQLADGQLEVYRSNYSAPGGGKRVSMEVPLLMAGNGMASDQMLITQSEQAADKSKSALQKFFHLVQLSGEALAMLQLVMLQATTPRTPSLFATSPILCCMHLCDAM